MMKAVNFEGSNFLNNLRKFNEAFSKDVTYDNIKSRKKAEVHPLSRKYISGKTTQGGKGFKLTIPQPFKG